MINTYATYTHTRTGNRYLISSIGKVKLLWWWFDCVGYYSEAGHKAWRDGGPTPPIWTRLTYQFKRAFKEVV